jgi:D-glycero-D-manno-heptose 1,7-bisphosphate phosphatase
MQQDIPDDLELNAILQVMAGHLRLLSSQEQMGFLANFSKELIEFAKRAEQDKTKEQRMQKFQESNWSKYVAPSEYVYKVPETTGLTTRLKTYKLVISEADGTLVRTKSGETFRKSANDWKWLPRRLQRIHSLIDSGIIVAIATNQGGVAFGYMKSQDIQDELTRMCIEARVYPDRLYVCYSHPKASLDQYREDSDRRKPGPGMLWEAMNDADILPEDTLMVGDRDEDEQAAKAAGVDFIHADEYFK